jgi:hypothetical protein
MANPLTTRQPAPQASIYPYHDKPALVEIYNDELRSKGREDVEWAIADDGSLYLRDRYAYTERKSKWLKARFDRETQINVARQSD